MSAARARHRLAFLLGAAMVLALLPATSADAAGSFWDDDLSVHERQIEGIAAAGVTQGCDPPANSQFCTFDAITRGQIAAFFDRALDLPRASRDWFVDDEDSIFESAINRMAEAGITKGCNPPADDRYCPESPTTRGQMAAFLTRTYVMSGSDVDFFTDDQGSIFESAINDIAAAGVTKGCDPPTNDRYCPADVVRRGQMASFITRADQDIDPLDPDRLHERTITYDVGRRGGGVSSGEEALLARRAAEALYAETSWNIRHRLLLEELDGGGDFTLWLTDADLVDEQAPVCSEAYSCTVGDDIYINRANFFDRPAPWNGRSQTEYQRYLVLHETGHFLDFNDTADPSEPSHYNHERYCIDGQAPVMKQQSITTGGCTTNLYPLPFERDCVEEAWLADTTDQGDGDGDRDDQCPHAPTARSASTASILSAEADAVNE